MAVSIRGDRTVTAYAVRRTLEQQGVSLDDYRHAESLSGAPVCDAEAEGAFVVDDPEDADCPACRLLVLGRRGLN